MRWKAGAGGHKIALIVCGAVLCLLTALFGLSVTGIFKIPFLESAVSFVVTPVQGFVTNAYNAVRSGLEERATIAQLNEEIARLTEENRRLQAEMSSMEELERENERLLGLLGVTEVNPETEYVAASVVAKEAGGWFSVFTVNKGARDGVEKDDPVLSDEGLIGRVMEVTDSTSVVLTLIDSRSAVAGLVERTRDNGICHGSLYVYENDEMLRMNYLPEGSELNTGNRVITSGLDGVYPKGLFIGTVRSISRESSGDGRYVVLSPAVDFAHIEEVLIMTGGQAAEE